MNGFEVAARVEPIADVSRIEVFVAIQLFVIGVRDGSEAEFVFWAKNARCVTAEVETGFEVNRATLQRGASTIMNAGFDTALPRGRSPTGNDSRLSELGLGMMMLSKALFFLGTQDLNHMHA